MIMLILSNTRALYQYPVLSLFPLDIHTDFERRFVPFFQIIEVIDDLYFKCKDLFDKCKSESGFLRGPPKELKTVSLAALEDFNIHFGGLCYPSKYASNILVSIDKFRRDGIRRIRSHKYSLQDIEYLIANPDSNGNIKNAGDLINQIYYLIRWG